MPSSDLILNVRQLAGYAQTGQALTSDSVLLQRGLGGPYLTISPADLVGTALATGGSMVVGGQLSATAFQGGAGQFTNVAAGILTAQQACLTEFDATWGSINGVPIATQADVANAAAVLQNLYDTATVRSLNGRTGDVCLWVWDIINAGGAPIVSPRFEGDPRARTPAPWSNGTRLATTGFVHRNSVEYITNLLRDHPFVFSFNGRTGDVTLTSEDLAGAEAALLNSPQLVGTPTAPTAAVGDSSTLISNTEFVTNAVTTAANSASTDLATAIASLANIYAPIYSPVFTGFPQADTAPPGTHTGQLATTAFVMDAITESTTGVASFNTRTGTVTLQASDITGAGGALLASPNFSGVPTAPTAAPGTTSDQVATCAWVMNELGGASIGVMSFNGRGGAVTLNTSDITSAGGAPAASPVLTGDPTAPTQATGTNNTTLATTAFVASALANMSVGVSSFQGRTGVVTLTSGDISAAGGAVLSSPAFINVPTAPTAAPGTSTTQLATTGFVMAAIAAANIGVATFNGRAGAVTLASTDVNAAAAGGPYVSQAGPSTINQATINAPILTGSTANVVTPAGQVGEIVLQSFGGFAMSNNTAMIISTLTLTPGYWRIEASVAYQTQPNNAVMQQGYAWISTNAADNVNNNSANVGGFAISPAAISFWTVQPPSFYTTLTTVYLYGYITVTSGGLQATAGFIRAIRYR